MVKDNGKCGVNCDCLVGMCVKENGKCGVNCDCLVGNIGKELDICCW